MNAQSILADIPTYALPRILDMPEHILIVTHAEVRQAIADRAAAVTGGNG